MYWLCKSINHIEHSTCPFNLTRSVADLNSYDPICVAYRFWISDCYYDYFRWRNLQIMTTIRVYMVYCLGKFQDNNLSRYWQMSGNYDCCELNVMWLRQDCYNCLTLGRLEYLVVHLRYNAGWTFIKGSQGLFQQFGSHKSIQY